ncbi:MAG: ThuA domain-containing protein [Candidatus Latescibacterota bacterium]|nr:ThuA domain-containing protein [Candidatus Latescibacterota bacterium]
MTDDLKVVLISGSFEYDSEESLVILRDYLHENVPARVDGSFRCQLVIFRHEEDTVSLRPVDDADVVVLFTRRLLTAGIELDRFRRYCESGRPLVGLRTASHGFQNWLALDRDVLGGNYDGHYGPGETTLVEIADGAEVHPVLMGVQPFEAYGSLYKNTPIAEDARLLLRGYTEQHTEPVAWTCERRSRVAYTSLGHQKDFWELDFLQLVENSVLWAAGRT